MGTTLGGLHFNRAPDFAGAHLLPRTGDVEVDLLVDVAEDEIVD
jgi:hypothetical protein